MGDGGGREFSAAAGVRKLNHRGHGVYGENQEDTSLPTGSTLASPQVFLGAAVAVSEGESGAVFVGSGTAVSFSFQHMTQHVVRLESRGLLHGSGKIAAQQTLGQRIVPCRPEENGGRIAP